MGETGRRAVAPVTEDATPPPPVEPDRPPVKTKIKILSQTARPKYTRAALRAGVEGKIVLRIYVDENGRVYKVKSLPDWGMDLTKKPSKRSSNGSTSRRQSMENPLKAISDIRDSNSKLKSKFPLILGLLF